jgi:hypothetical protein
MALKTMALRRDDRCSSCGALLSAGTTAEWDSTAKVVTCLACVERRPTANTSSTPLAPPPIDPGTAGVSARKEHARRSAERAQRIADRWGSGRIGRIATHLAEEPQSTTAWAKGAKGEERVAEILHQHLGEEAVLLHDRKVGGTRGNIDHLAIAPNGVWIIDAKHYKGKVERRDVGGFFKTDMRLYVGGRDRTKAVASLAWQLDAVRKVLGDSDLPIHRALTFVGTEWPLFFAKPLQIDGVWVTWPAKLAEMIGAAGPLSLDEIERTARMLSERLPANRG